MAEITVVVSIFGYKLQKRTLANLCGKLIHWKFVRELAEQRGEVVIEGLEGQELGQLM